MNRMDTAFRRALPLLVAAVLAVGAGMATPALALAQDSTAAPRHEMGGEANLVIPDLSTVQFFGMSGHALLTYGLIVCALGLLFGLVIFFDILKARM